MRLLAPAAAVCRLPASSRSPSTRYSSLRHAQKLQHNRCALCAQALSHTLLVKPCFTRGLSLSKFRTSTGCLGLGQQIIFDCGRPNTLKGTGGAWAVAPQGFGAALQQLLLRHDQLLRGLAAAPLADGPRDGPAMTVLQVVAATQGVRRELLTLASLCSGGSSSGTCIASSSSLL